MRKWLKNTEFYKRHKYRLLRANDLLSFFSALCLILFLLGDQSRQDLLRREMISEVKTTAVITGLHTGIYHIDDSVLRAMASVPRDSFLSWGYRRYAYTNAALPLDGKEYMIPEPFVTAMMVHLMKIQPGDKVMEIGYGVGYEAAVMSKLASAVYSVRQTAPLNKRLNHYEPLEKRGYTNVFTKTANGPAGWIENGPFDAILVKQSLRAPPRVLIDQLRPGGRLVVPVGDPYEDTQRLMVYFKDINGEVTAIPSIFIQISPLFKGEEI